MSNPKKKSALPWIWGFVAVVVLFMYLTKPSEKPAADPIDTTLQQLPPAPTLPVPPPTSNLPVVSSDHWGKGHQAGYDWATDHPEVTEEDCDEAGRHSNSPSFAEGCRSLIEDKKLDGAAASQE